MLNLSLPDANAQLCFARMGLSLSWLVAPWLLGRHAARRHSLSLWTHLWHCRRKTTRFRVDVDQGVSDHVGQHLLLNLQVMKCSLSERDGSLNGPLGLRHEIRNGIMQSGQNLDLISDLRHQKLDVEQRL